MSKAFEAYAWSDLITLKPDRLLDEHSKYSKTWSSERMIYLVQKLVETAGPAHDHVFTKILKEEFEQGCQMVRRYLPGTFPHPLIAKKAIEVESRASGAFTKGHVSNRIEAHLQKARRTAISTVMRQQTLNFRYQKPQEVEFPLSAHDVIGRTRFAAIQATPSTEETAVQTEPIAILSEPVELRVDCGETRQIHPDALGMVANLPRRLALPRVNNKLGKQLGGHRNEPAVLQTAKEYKMQDTAMDQSALEGYSTGLEKGTWGHKGQFSGQQHHQRAGRFLPERVRRKG